MNTCCTPTTGASAQTIATTGIKPRYLVDGGKDAYTIKVELPGVKKGNLDIHLDRDLLTIRAKRNRVAEAGWKTLHQEMIEEDFVLRLKLNSSVNEGKLTAKLEHGVLTVDLPIKDAVKPRAIPVS
jgi:HSP20 family protein